MRITSLNYISNFIIFIGFLFTYIAPLAIVLIVILLKEALDDISRWRRDKELNNKLYE
jgi:phospholipid-translocating ATPase